jgi:XRE family transcriptional regulator of biofilm formation|nr:MAG TPA: helix-turn-helix domain protein [Caudoviricetes sp.]
MIVFRIKQIRESKNITAYRLAKDVKISRSYLSELENNKKMNVSLEVLVNIADYLNVNVKDLFYTTFDINSLKQKMYRRIDKYGINSKEALEVSQIIDLLINIDMRKL